MSAFFFCAESEDLCRVRVPVTAKHAVADKREESLQQYGTAGHFRLMTAAEYAAAGGSA